jgi:hypothetical protein
MTNKRLITGILEIILVFAMTILASCITFYDVPDQKWNYSGTIIVSGVESSDIYTRVALWMTNKVGDPYSPKPNSNIYKWGESKAYSKTPYFQNINYSSNKKISGFLTFLYKKIPSYGYENDHFSQFIFTIKDETCDFEIIRVGKNSDGILSPKKYEHYRQDYNEYRKLWNYLVTDLQNQLNASFPSYEEIDRLIEDGDNAFNNKHFFEAKEPYYEAEMAEPYRTDILALYAAALANINFYSVERQDKIRDTLYYNETVRRVYVANRETYLKARGIFEFVLALESKNEIANNGIKLCDNLIANMDINIAQVTNIINQEWDNIRSAVEESNKQTIADLEKNLNTFVAQIQRTQNNGTGNQSQPANSNSNKSSSSSGNKTSSTSNSRIANMEKNYNSRANITRDIFNRYQSALDGTGPYINNPASQSEKNRLRNELNSSQSSLKAYREECNRNGANIKASFYETAKPSV